MSELKEFTFIESKQITEYEKNYSYFLNELIKIRLENKCSLDWLAKAFKCSKGKLSNFENRIKDYDFVMLFNYAAFFKYKISMFLDKMSYREKMDN